jgi:hypothetical protein
LPRQRLARERHGFSLNPETAMVQNQAENLKSLPQIGAGPGSHERALTFSDCKVLPGLVSTNRGIARPRTISWNDDKS